MTALLDVENLSRHFTQGAGWFGKPKVLRAVDGVSFTVAPGRTLGLVGESGCGKTTTARLALGLMPPTGGVVRFDGNALPPANTPAWRGLRQKMQMVFQDPLSALDRRLDVATQIAEPLAIHTRASRADSAAKVEALMAAVGLQPHLAGRYPHELSGGQRQRVVLARALILEPKLLVCDEPVSALDVSIQAQVVNLLGDLQDKFGVAMLFISHDLKVVRQVAHEVAVMYLGRIVEQGAPEAVFAAPAHPYTQALVSAIPHPSRRGRPRIVLAGEPPNPAAMPPGCAFHPRCPVAIARCKVERPELAAGADGRVVACHLVAAAPAPARAMATA